MKIAEKIVIQDPPKTEFPRKIPYTDYLDIGLSAVLTVWGIISVMKTINENLDYLKKVQVKLFHKRLKNFRELQEIILEIKTLTLADHVTIYCLKEIKNNIYLDILGSYPIREKNTIPMQMNWISEILDLYEISERSSWVTIKLSELLIDSECYKYLSSRGICQRSSRSIDKENLINLDFKNCPTHNWLEDLDRIDQMEILYRKLKKLVKNAKTEWSLWDKILAFF